MRNGVGCLGSDELIRELVQRYVEVKYLPCADEESPFFFNRTTGVLEGLN